MARDVLVGSPSAAEAAVAHQTIGVVLRDFGAIDDAVVELRTAHRWARRAGDRDLVTDIRASLGVAFLFSGRTRAALAILDEAVRDSSGVRAGRVLIRRALAFWVLGRNAEALDDARRAVVLLSGRDDLVWEARALHHRAAVHLSMGAVAAAERDYGRCEQLHARIGQQLEHANVRHERGVLAYARGDLPDALALLYDAEQMFDGLAVFEPQLFVSKCTVLLAAGLNGDAVQDMDRAVATIEEQRGPATRRAELLFGAALAAFAAGDPHAAATRNEEALKLFRRQQRRWWAARAELLGLQCAEAVGAPVAPGRARRVAASLGRLDPDRAVGAHLIVGRVALAAGRRVEARRHLRRAAAARSRPTGEQAAGWLAQALLCREEDRARGMLAACRRGLEVLELHLWTLGATELRTIATAKGNELAGLALAHALRRGDARRLLEWSERWRAVVLAVPPVHPPQDSELVGDLAALRHLGIRLDETPPTGQGVAALQRERRRLETSVRRRALQMPGESPGRAATFSCDELLAQLGTADLVELVDVDGELHAVVAGGGRTRIEHLGRTVEAEESLTHARFALRREAGRPGAPRLDMEAVGRHLEARLLGGALRGLRGESLVVVPPGRLHSVPWGLLPSLRGRPTAVVPSAAAWLRARRAVPPPDGRVVLVGGPRLATGSEEVRALAAQYPDAVVLADGHATVDDVMAAMDGASLVHIAAHGTFRADSPQFSAIELDDGPLTVYDLERLHRAPHRVVLANCSSGLRAPAGADELLGVVSALVALGSAGVLASVVPVGDAPAVPFMRALHEQLRKDQSLPEALMTARLAVGDDRRAAVAADSFIALGC